MENTFYSVIFKHGNDDYSLWNPELSENQMKKLSDLLEEFQNNGSSIRGSKEDILAELKNIL